ncbi:hypothetical protein GCM10027291_31430 [Telluribacter humicola]
MAGKLRFAHTFLEPGIPDAIPFVSGGRKAIKILALGGKGSQDKDYKYYIAKHEFRKKDCS